MATALLNALLYFPQRGLHSTPAAAGLGFRDVQFATDDGERLHGWWIPPADGAARAHVLHFHGNAGTIADRLFEARILSELGLDVLLFDYRGYGQSSGRPSEQGTYRDARAARGALLRQPGVDPSRIIYIGESLGGAVATELAIQHAPRGLVLRSTFTSIRALGQLHYPVVPLALVPNAYPTLERVGTLACPLLIIHGTRDAIAPFAHAEALLAAARPPKRLARIEGAGHNDILGFEAQRSALADWLRTLLE